MRNSDITFDESRKSVFKILQICMILNLNRDYILKQC